VTTPKGKPGAQEGNYTPRGLNKTRISTRGKKRVRSSSPNVGGKKNLGGESRAISFNKRSREKAHRTSQIVKGC